MNEKIPGTPAMPTDEQVQRQVDALMTRLPRRSPMIEIRTRNGGRGVGEVTDFDGTHLLFVVDDGKRMVWVPIDRIVWVSPA